MTMLNVTVLLHKLMLNFLEFRAVYFFELTTTGADEMIMVFVIVFVLVTQGAITKVNRPAKT